ncbi:MAG: hypothetical protein WCK05_13045 [Planctomycetota bacterium]
MNCNACGDTGLHFIPSTGTQTLAGYIIERCDHCQKFESDWEAAEASGCTFHEGPDETFIIDDCPPDSVLGRRNHALRNDPEVRRLWEEA